MTQSALGLSRRNFLRGLGVGVALPGMLSALPRAVRAAETAKAAPLRMAFMSVPNGVQQDHWWPTGDERDFTFNTTMHSLTPLKSHVQVIGGLKHENATAGRDGAGDHARASATFLTGQRARKTAGKDIHVGVSVDQLAAQKLGRRTRFPSLELSCDAIRNSGSCDSGYACAYQYNLAWSSPTTPVTPEANPRLAFERLFGAGSPEERRKNYALRQETERSVLDFILEEAGDVQRQLNPGDRRKLDEYFTVVRELEQRLKASEATGDLPKSDRETPSGIPADFSEHMALMYDLLFLAFQTDSTRFGTILLAYDGSNRVFPQIGVPEGHHYLTHNQRKEELAEKVARIDAYYMEQFASFLTRMSVAQDVDGQSLLDNSMIVYGGAIADGNKHSHDNLPVILAGSGGGRLQPGRYLQVPEQPMANLFVSLLNRLEIATDRFGDSTGRLEPV
ncbi:MAG: DUF1552 domain-containing protein [Planctomycetaceae bacterium]|nr:DUF1552 domain-containing protein [Planctomycetaceae bacterium]